MIIVDIFPSDSEKEIIIKNDLGEKFKISLSDAKENGLFGLNEEDFPFEFEDDGQIIFLSSKLKAIKYCSYLLSFSDKSASALKRKLYEKQYSEKVSQQAIEVLVRAGLIDDDTICIRKANNLAKSKLYGPYRIKMELLKKGFAKESIENALQETDVDFDECLTSLIKKLNSDGKYDLKDRDTLIKFKAKLQRYGYDTSKINKHLNNYETED